MIIKFRFAVKNPPFLNGDANVPFFYNARIAKKNNGDYKTCIANLKNKFISDTFTDIQPISGGLYKAVDFYTYQIILPVAMGDVYDIYKRKYMEVQLGHEEFVRYGGITDIAYSTQQTMQITFLTDEGVTFFEKLEFDPSVNLNISRRMPKRYVKNEDKIKIDWFGFSNIIDGGINSAISDNLFYDDVKCEKYLVDTSPVIQKTDSAPVKSGFGFFMGTETPSDTTPAYYIYALISPKGNPSGELVKPYSDSRKALNLPSGAFIAPCQNDAYTPQDGIAIAYSDIAALPNENILGVFALPLPPEGTDLQVDVSNDIKVNVYAYETNKGSNKVGEPRYPNNGANGFDMDTVSTSVLKNGIIFNTLHLNDTYYPQYAPIEYAPHTTEGKFTGITGDSTPYNVAVLTEGIAAGQTVNFGFSFSIAITAGLVAGTGVPNADFIKGMPQFSYRTYFDAHIPNGATAGTNYMANNKSQFNTSLLQNSLGTGIAPFAATSLAVSGGYNAVRSVESAAPALADVAEVGALASVGVTGFIGLGMIMGAAFKLASQIAQKHDLMRQAYQTSGMASGTALTSFQGLLSSPGTGESQQVDYYVGMFSEGKIPANVLRQLHINSYMYGNPIPELRTLQFADLQSREMGDVWFIDNAETAFMRGNVAESVLDRISAKLRAGLRIGHYQEADGFNSVYNYERMNGETFLEVQE